MRKLQPSDLLGRSAGDRCVAVSDEVHDRARGEVEILLARLVKQPHTLTANRDWIRLVQGTMQNG